MYCTYVRIRVTTIMNMMREIAMGQYTVRELQPQMKMYTCPFVLESITDRRQINITRLLIKYSIVNQITLSSSGPGL